MNRKTTPRFDPAFRATIAGVLKALGHPVRLHIVETLARGEHTVGALQKTLAVGQATVSQQIGVLRNAGVVAVRREGNRRHYALANPHLVNLLRCLASCREHCA